MADYSTWFDRVWSAEQQQWMHECRFCRGRVKSPDDFEAHMRDPLRHSQSQRQGVFEVLTNSIWATGPTSSSTDDDYIYRKIKEISCSSKETKELRDLVQSKLQYMECAQERESLYARVGQAFLEGRHVGREIAPLLARAEKHKPLYLLELAVWKHACSSTLPTTPSPLTSLTAVLQWQKEGWKKNKASHFRCNHVMVIMDCIVPFLVQEKPKLSEMENTTTSSGTSASSPATAGTAARRSSEQASYVSLPPAATAAAATTRRIRSRSETTGTINNGAVFRRIYQS